MATRRGGLLLVAGLALSVPAAASDFVKTIRAELTGPELSRFAVENLVGTMRISPGSGDTLTVEATVHAQSQALADAVRLEKVPGTQSGTTLRVRYPYDEVRTFRYQSPDTEYDGFFFGFDSGNRYDYDGRRVRVSRGHGVRLYVDLEVRVPRGRLNAAFRNLVGLLEAEGLQGELRFDVKSADLRLAHLDGEISLGGSSGDVRARDIRGRWKSDFASGDCRLEGFEGEALRLRVASGDISARDVKALRVEITSSSGDARLVNADVQDFAAEANSGDVELDTAGSRLASVRVRTSSGDVRLRLPADAAFDAEGDQSSGEMRVGFSDGTSTRRREELVAYRRGSGGARIRVHTSSGDFSISPH